MIYTNEFFRNGIKARGFLALFFTLFLFIPLFASCSKNPNNDEPEPDVEIEDTSDVDFFKKILNGHNEEFSTKPIAISDIKKTQEIVWDAWKEANKSYNETKLIALKPLDKANYSVWTLPSKLEPDAKLKYFYGTKGVKPDAGFPLFLYLHGSGDKDAEWNTGFELSKRFNDSPSAYFIPQIPNTGDYYRWWQKAKQYAWEKMLRQAFVSENINPNKIYFFGISEGGYGSQRLASFYADYLAGAGPMAGGEPLKNAPVENCMNTAFSFLTGADDTGFYRNTLTRYTKEEFEKWKNEYPEAFIHRIELLEGYGHSIDYDLTTPWLIQHTRNPYPKNVLWENYEMDGQYRNGFYNLYVKERSNIDENTRTFYQYFSDGNNLTLKVDNVTYNTIEKEPVWGIEMKFKKSYTPSTKGKIVIYLCEELVDLSKEITLTVNGTMAFKGIVIPNKKHIVNSCAAFFDPARLYPAAIEVDLSKL